MSSRSPVKNVRIASWNVGGGKGLRLEAAERRRRSGALQRDLEGIVGGWDPDIVLLQEVTEFGEGEAERFVKPPLEYYCCFSRALDSLQHPHHRKWSNRGVETHTRTSQGQAILWKRSVTHAAFWNGNRQTGPGLQASEVRYETGIYSGNRDTEPRLVVVAHFVFDVCRSPVDLFVANLHLSTLRHERAGVIVRDRLGSHVRRAQLHWVLCGIVSRVNRFRSQQRMAPAVWVLGGDFNASPGSPEIRMLEENGFVDLNGQKGHGTKRHGQNSAATHTVDYLFAGIAGTSIDPVVLGRQAAKNPKPLEKSVSDHLPIVADLPLESLCLGVDESVTILDRHLQPASECKHFGNHGKVFTSCPELAR